MRKPSWDTAAAARAPVVAAVSGRARPTARIGLRRAGRTNDEPLESGGETVLQPPRPGKVDPGAYVAIHLALVPAALGLLAWGLQHGRLDMALARLFVDASGQHFVWRDSALLDILGHQAARGLPFLIGAIAIAGGVAGLAVRSLRPWMPILLVTGAAMVLGPLAINLLKGMTTPHCPSAMQSFGGVVDYAAEQSGPFWAMSQAGAGHCSPSGHAGGGYAVLSLYFAGWAAGRPAWRWRGLAIGIVAGLVFSIVRMMQGAHFASATLWSGAIDWTICALLFMPLLCRATTPAD
jgi:membrane-associated PAP2 superfamily phosphatase